MRLNLFLRKKEQSHYSAERKFSARFLFDPLFLLPERVVRHRVTILEYADDSDSPATPESAFATFSALPQGAEAQKSALRAIKDTPASAISKALKNCVLSSSLKPARRYTFEVEFLVKWRSLPITESTWESLHDIARKARPEGGLGEEAELTRFSAKKCLSKVFSFAALGEQLARAARLYEAGSDLKAKLRRLRLESPPKTKRDPLSARGSRPASLPGGTPFAEWTPPPYKNGHRLKQPYQEDGVRWLIYNWHMKRNCILADEMGLGKTIQSIGFVAYLLDEQRLRGPVMVVAPKSTLANWQREFNEWTDFNVLTYDGHKRSRELIREHEFFFEDEKSPGKTVPNLTKFDVILTSYGLIMADKVLADFHYSLVVVDEAHRLKNPESRLFQELSGYHKEHCVLLTGTPLQNNIAELWALLNLLEPAIFHSEEEFEKRYDTTGADSARRIGELHSLVLKPFMLRRVKSDVELKLKPAKEVVIWLRLTREQKKYFRAIYEQNTAFLHAEGRKNAPSLMNVFMQLRHCCNHPFVLRGVEDRMRRERGLKGEEAVMKALVEVSCKMDFLDKFLPTMKAQGHKVLIFSQFVMILDIIDDYLAWRGYSFERIDGNVDLDTRQNAIDRYNSDETNFVFLLSTRAGGLGINLTSADTVIIYDSDWNPQNDLQAQARAHRIGQTKKVTVYRLITKGSYEEIMFQKAGKKLGLEKALLSSWINSGREIEKGKSGDLNKEELEKLLKFGAYHVLRDQEEDSKPQSIQDILAASEVVTVGGSASESKGDAILSQATFKNTLDDNLSLDDPNFWQKIGLPKQKPAPFLGRRTRRAPRDSWQRNREESASSFSASASSAESFGSDEGGRWSRTERNAFDEALLRFGYGRWVEIKAAAKTQKSDSICKQLALGLVKLCVRHSERTAHHFLRSLRSDLADVVTRQVMGLDSDDDGPKAAEEFDDLGGKRGGAVDSIVARVEKKRSVMLKDSLELFEELELEAVLSSSKWQEKRFKNTKTDDLKTLENCWILNNIKKKNIPPNILEKILTSSGITESSKPTDTWTSRMDIFCLDLAFEHGMNHWFDKFNKKWQNSTIPSLKEKLEPTSNTPPEAAPSSAKLRRRLNAVLFKTKSLAFAEQKARKTPTKPMWTKNGIPAPPKPTWTKVQGRALRRILNSFPIRNPLDKASWTFLFSKPIMAVLESYSLRSLFPAQLVDFYRLFKGELFLFEQIKDERLLYEAEKNSLFEMTRFSSKKSRSRLKLFERIFRVLDLPDAENRLMRVREIKFPVPTWTKGKSDLDLHKAIVKHGYGSWPEMRNDITFRNLFKNYKEPLPKDCKVLARLEVVHKHVLSAVVFPVKIPIDRIHPPKGPLPLKRVICLSDNEGRKENKTATVNFSGPRRLRKHLVLLSLGRVVFDCPRWHTQKFIFPVGFKVEYTLNDYRYLCEILSFDGLENSLKEKLSKTGVNRPVFKISKKFCGTKIEIKKPKIEEKSAKNSGTVKDNKQNSVEKVFYSLSLVKMTKRIKKEIEKTKDGEKPLMASELFGFRDAKVAKLIESLKNSNLCEKYVPRLDKPPSGPSKHLPAAQKTKTTKTKKPQKSKQLSISSFVGKAPPSKKKPKEEHEMIVLD